jgi:hypothetical protein
MVQDALILKNLSSKIKPTCATDSSKESGSAPFSLLIFFLDENILGELCVPAPHKWINKYRNHYVFIPRHFNLLQLSRLASCLSKVHRRKPSSSVKNLIFYHPSFFFSASRRRFLPIARAGLQKPPQGDLWQYETGEATLYTSCGLKAITWLFWGHRCSKPPIKETEPS